MSKNIGIWLRVSTQDQVEGDSLEHHEQRARTYAEFQEWNVKEIYRLEAVSGKSVINHPEAQRMLRDIQSGKITAIIFSKLSRLARNTRELLDIAEIFQKANADLISLQEKIDTSSPAGKFFFTLIAAMSTWEREEIASRVAASVPIRAKMGKPLGGKPPYGYKRVNGELLLDEKEAPIRKLMFELFAKHQRKKKVRDILNDKGYRTRNGAKFSDTTIHRLLRDPIAKGLRRANYTKSLGEGKKWEMKPEEDWVFHPAPRIVNDELWQKCNDILDDMATKNVRTKGVHIFSGLVWCQCGAKMYMRSQSPRYVCQKCKNKIDPDILEKLFHDRLQQYLMSEEELQETKTEQERIIADKERLLSVLETEVIKLKEQEDDVFNLYHEKMIDKNAFKEKHQPIYELRQAKNEAKKDLQLEIDVLHQANLAENQALLDARVLYSKWNAFSKETKKSIVENITISIIVHDTLVKFNLYAPQSKKNFNSQLTSSLSHPSNETPPSSHNWYKEATHACCCVYHIHPEIEWLLTVKSQ